MAEMLIIESSIDDDGHGRRIKSSTGMAVLFVDREGSQTTSRYDSDGRLLIYRERHPDREGQAFVPGSILKTVLPPIGPPSHACIPFPTRE